MTTQPTISLTLLNLLDFNVDEEVLEKRTRKLLQEVKELDEVENAHLVVVKEIPEGSKALAGTLLGALQVIVTFENIKKLFAFLGDRLGEKAIEIELEFNGKKMKVKASSRVELESAQQFILSLYGVEAVG